MSHRGRRAPRAPYSRTPELVVHRSLQLIESSGRFTVSRQIIYASGRTEAELVGTYKTADEAATAVRSHATAA